MTPAVPTVESNRIVLTDGSKVIYLTATGTVRPTYKTWSTTCLPKLEPYLCIAQVDCQRLK